MPLAGAACGSCAVCSVAVVILVPDAVPQRLKPPQMRAVYGAAEAAPFQISAVAPIYSRRLLRHRRRYRLCGFLLLLPVADRRANGVFSQYGTMDLHRRKRQLL